MVIVFLTRFYVGLYFSTSSFGKLVFRLSVFSLNQDIKICVIMLWSFPHKENYPPVRVGVSVKVRVSFRVGTEPNNCSGGQLTPG